jgi:tRNA 2-thiocytidine biosynthesis protein TtcA
VVKQMLVDWERQFPGRIDQIFAAVQNISPSQLADTDLFDFETLKIEREEVDLSAIKAINL